MNISCVLLLVFLATFVHGDIQTSTNGTSDEASTSKTNVEVEQPESTSTKIPTDPKFAQDDDGSASATADDKGSEGTAPEAPAGGSSSSASPETSQEGGASNSSEVAGGGSSTSVPKQQEASASSEAPDATTLNATRDNASATTEPLTTQSPDEVTTLSNTDEPEAAPNGNNERAFDGWSFFGGIMLTVSVLAVSVVGFKYYKARKTGIPSNYDRF